MKKLMKRIGLLVTMAMVSMVTSAEEEVRSVSLIVDELTGGTITKTAQAVSEADPSRVVVTISVAPAEGYQISKNDLKIWAVLPLPTTPPSGTRTPEVSGVLTLDGDDPDELSEERTYQVTIDPNLDIWVEKADFRKVEEKTQTWSLTEGVLKISGEVDVEAGVPWDRESVTSVVIDYGEKVLDLGALGISEEKSVEVPGHLLNEYLFDYKGFKLDSQDKTEIAGFSFGESNSYDTFVATTDIIVPSVLKAYVITNITEDGLTIKEVTSIAKGEPVIVFAEDKYKEIEEFYTVETDPVEASSNLLKVAPDGGKSVGIGEVFMLYNDVFYYTQAGTIPEGSVYLAPQESKTRGFYSLGGDNNTTGIASHRIVNTDIQSSWYTLDGRQLPAQPTKKGIYIRDGKKVIIK